MQKEALVRIEKRYTQAVKDFRSGNFPAAKKVFTSLLKEYSEVRDYFVPAVIAKIRVHLSMIEAKESPQGPPLKTNEDKLNQALYDLNAGSSDSALKMLDGLLSKNYNKAYVHYLMSLAFLKKNDLKSGLDHLGKAIKLDKFYRILAYNESDFEPWSDKKEFLELVKISDSE